MKKTEITKMSSNAAGAYTIPIALATTSSNGLKTDSIIKTMPNPSQSNEYSSFSFFRFTSLRINKKSNKLPMTEKT
jgi:hypothetical protein